jgi:hypothetical protein
MKRLMDETTSADECNFSNVPLSENEEDRKKTMSRIRQSSGEQMPSSENEEDIGNTGMSYSRPHPGSNWDPSTAFPGPYGPSGAPISGWLPSEDEEDRKKASGHSQKSSVAKSPPSGHSRHSSASKIPSPLSHSRKASTSIQKIVSGTAEAAKAHIEKMNRALSPTKSREKMDERK